MEYNDIIRARGPLIVIDTETGGLDPVTHSILSIALVSIDGERQLECFIREPELVTNPESMAINKIDLEWVKEHGLSPKEACDQIDHFLQEEVDRSGGGRALFIGHNVAFDLAFFKRLYRFIHQGTDHPLVSHRSLDTHTLLWALAAHGVIPPQACGSDGAFTHYNVSPPAELRHTALGDAVATRALFHDMMADIFARREVTS